MADDAPAVMFVRFRRGVVGEWQRVVHVVPVPDPDVMPAVLMAYCGVEIPPRRAERLEEPVGMPCVLCLARALPGDQQFPGSAGQVYVGDGA